MQTASSTEPDREHRDMSLRGRRARPSTTAPDYTSTRVLRRSRAFRAGGMALVGIVLLLALFNALGPRYETETQTVPGETVSLLYPEVTRPGLASRWVLFVHRAGGFSGAIDVATTARWFQGFDYNNTFPDAASQVSRGDTVVFRFDPPPGDTLRIEIDMATTPTWTFVRHATTTVRGGGVTPVSISYRTLFLP
jgi:hypothetical protein